VAVFIFLFPKSDLLRKFSKTFSFFLVNPWVLV
jgi:hypothetical protein